MSTTTLAGLTSAEVEERKRRGQVNRVRRSDAAEYRDIVFRNLFTLFNALVVPAAIALFLLQEYQGAIAVSGMATINTVLGLVQEIRAKRHLDQLTLLVETRARVVRDGKEVEVPAGDVVLGDHILLQAGEPVVADGTVVEARFLEIDEALLTGESDPIPRHPGDRLLSGSFCVAGEGAYRADRVGAEAFAQSTATEARAYHHVASPMQHGIDRIIQLLTAITLAFSALYVGVFFVRPGFGERELVQAIAATVTSMVPQGLVLMATLAFTLGAVRMSRRGAIVQRLSAVETMAAIDVLCMDKTGTLTTNRLRLARLVPLAGRSEEDVRRRLRLFASASLDRQSKSLQALRSGLSASPLSQLGRGVGGEGVLAPLSPLGRGVGGEGEEEKAELLDQIPFKSQNRYSAVRVKADGHEHVLALGACEALEPRLADTSWRDAWKELQATGLRILMFAESERREPFNGTLDGFPLRPLALVALSDELRPEAGAVLEMLAAQGIRFKVISGDNPDTVRATVAHLKLPLANEPVVSGDQLASPQKDELIATRSVFGRVSPRQKVEIVEGLQKQGNHVAMIGDGVNDVLPIKKADLGIAMGEGSRAAKTVADLVLETNNFDLLPETLEEGRTILRNLRRSSKLFLLKNVYTLILILGFIFLGGEFPYLPQQVTLLNFLTIGIPALIITLSKERSTAATKSPFLREVGSFVLRSGLVIGIAGLVLTHWARAAWPEDEVMERMPPLSSLLPLYPKDRLPLSLTGVDLHRTLLLSALVLLGITALLRALTDGEEKPLLGDRRFRWLAIGALPVYLLAMYWGPPARFFRLAALHPAEWGMVLAVVVPAFLLCKLSDRWAARPREQS
jgi:cation-transporting P-type ATPase E